MAPLPHQRGSAARHGALGRECSRTWLAGAATSPASASWQVRHRNGHWRPGSTPFHSKVTREREGEKGLPVGTTARSWLAL